MMYVFWIRSKLLFTGKAFTINSHHEQHYKNKKGNQYRLYTNSIYFYFMGKRMVFFI